MKESSMSEIKIERQPSDERLKGLGVESWPTWTKEVSEFPWSQGEAETCYSLEGDVVVTPDGADPVEVGQGDLVTFPAGMSCTWKVRKPVRKHYRMG
jgi:uncharacterized cupin superfamily protein